jgi:hypothetical protein
MDAEEIMPACRAGRRAINAAPGAERATQSLPFVPQVPP